MAVFLLTAIFKENTDKIRDARCTSDFISCESGEVYSLFRNTGHKYVLRNDTLIKI